MMKMGSNFDLQVFFEVHTPSKKKEIKTVIL